MDISGFSCTPVNAYIAVISVVPTDVSRCSHTVDCSFKVAISCGLAFLISPIYADCYECVSLGFPMRNTKPLA